MQSIIFVCLGNICRSPIAEGCAKKLANEKNIDITIESAGTGSWHVGDVPDPYFFNGFEGFDEAFMMIDECVKNLLEKEG